MRNFNIIFANNFHESDSLGVSHELHWSEILAAFCAIKKEYFRKHNLNILSIQSNEQVSDLYYLRSIHGFICMNIIMLFIYLMFLIFFWWFILLVLLMFLTSLCFLIFSCWHSSFCNLWNKKICYINQTIEQLVMFAYGKSVTLNKSSYTSSICVTT